MFSIALLCDRHCATYFTAMVPDTEGHPLKHSFKNTIRNVLLTITNVGA